MAANPRTQFTNLDGQLEYFDLEECVSDQPAEMIKGGPKLQRHTLPNGRVIEQHGYPAPGPAIQKIMWFGGPIGRVPEWESREVEIPDAYHAKYVEVPAPKKAKTAAAAKPGAGPAERGTLDHRAAIQQTKNPGWTYEQLASALHCSPRTLRNKEKYKLLAAARIRIKSQKDSYRRGNNWEDRQADD